ncbi:MAG: hypothetical protein JRF59_01940 [Deltaproteobacteria bacterium]|nr:hypothetical protein [Deltaproteobacteria bacterium]MBW1922538.1 hypothetical protein [Deltaproteobacteria bacterium]MBW1948395.1 hypothetical protein [Deltaproteobacteria bacterium]MBW2007096.1 hypothetical protein [Deltaproteobacteria bacterium]MBW2346589.1 hypothetical protein [Deltaproteobacteria bacterium]
MRILSRLKKKAGKVSERMDQYQEAIAFAEAGQPAQAQQLFQAPSPEETQDEINRLLVIGRESTFSEEVINYALEMAKRMSYEIVALNTAPLSCDTFQIFSSSQKKLCQDFKALSKENVRAFQEEAQKMGIPFTHVIKYTDREEALEEIKQEFKDIEFVISDTESDRPVSRPEGGERVTQPIYVYSMV